jgi:hypothetical protein
MKRLIFASITVLLMLAFVAPAWALPFPVTDVRALGMGGAFVAAGEGIGAVQYNPALLAKNSTAGVVVPELVVRLEDSTGLIDTLDELENAYSQGDTTTVIALLDGLDTGEAVAINAYAGIGAGFGLFGISGGVTYGDLVYGVAYPDNIDTTPGGLVDPDSNTLEFRGIESRQLIFTGAGTMGNLKVGANMRSIKATTYTDSESLFTNPDIGPGDVTTGIESDETAVAWDVGAMFNLTPIFDVAVVARDLGGTDLGVIELDPRYRIGAALHLPAITVAGDYDISEDDSGGTNYQEWALGAEFDVWAIALRAGLSNNSGLSGAPTLIHLGVGLGFLDLGAAYAEDGDYYMAGVNLSLGF